MLVSFAAAIQGGLALEAEVTAEKKEGGSTSVNASGKFGLSRLFHTLVDTSASVEAAGSRSSESHEIRKESKAYTEASIAIILYHQLQQNGGYIVKPQSIKDLHMYSPGMLVEVAGTVEKNAVDAVIDYLDAVDILSKVATPEPQVQSKGKGVSQDKTPQSEIARMREALDKDRKRTPLSNVVVRCSEPANLNVVVTLRTENLRDLTLSELHRNSVRIVGKITRVIGKDEAMSSFENYGMSLLPPQMLNEVFLQITNTEGLVAEFTDVQVKGPAFQILPLMIFV
ncbi:MAG: hypothetical protein KME42_04280 [Tildeniella nuda ZEHNDER 1965/U140]|jgi:hypothetical protein|nr:hypothetical protein [Tildeniella nuda ZEHNDER 1965/U140]